MELIDYTNKWVSGEILEDLAMIAGGVLGLVLALAALTIDFFSKERGAFISKSSTVYTLSKQNKNVQKR